MHQKGRELKIELLELLGEKMHRQEIETARRAGAIVVDNADGSMTVIRLRFVKAMNGRPADCEEQWRDVSKI